MKRDPKFTPTDNPRRGPKSKYRQVLEQIKGMKAGEWREVATYTTRAGATERLCVLRGRLDLIPTGKWEFSTHRTGSGSRLMVKYLGPSRRVEMSWWADGKLKKLQDK